MRAKEKRLQARVAEAKREWDAIPLEDKITLYSILDKAKAEAKQKLDDPLWLLEKDLYYSSIGLSLR